MTDRYCPPLPSGSVDLDKLHEADARGEDLAKAIEDATTRVEPLTEEQFAELPSLTGKTKAELLRIATDEGVEADEGMTNAAITDKITMARAAAPLVDEDGNLLNPPAGNVGDEPSTLASDAADSDAAGPTE